MNPETVAQLASPAGRELIRSVQPYRDADVLKHHNRLRERGHASEMIAAVLTQARLQQRAQTKFGDRAVDLLFTAEGAEQATRAEVAALHAQRFASAGMSQHWDLGCGIGADAYAVASQGLALTAIDIDPTTAAIAAANLSSFEKASARVGVIEDEDLDLGARSSIWLDPARRVPGAADAQGRSRRISGLEEMAPPWSTVQRLAGQAGAAGAKYSPGFPAQSIPAGVEAVWVSYAGAALECALWWGLAVEKPGRSVMRAILAPSGTHSGRWARLAQLSPVSLADAAAGYPQVSAGSFLYDPDKAALAADLLDSVAIIVGGAEVGPQSGYLSSTSSVDTGWARRWRVVEVLPFNIKAIRSWARSNDIGTLTLKRRGHGPDPATLRRQLKLKGTAEATLVVTKLGDELAAIWVELDGPSHADLRS